MTGLAQSDCRCGSLGFAAGEDLSLASGKLAKLNSGKDLVLPASAVDVTPYVLALGADTGYLCGAIPLCSAANARVVLSGACDAGDKLVSKGDGRVEKSAEGNAGALLIGIAEEAGIDGQHVLLRPVSVGAKGETGAEGPAGVAGREAGTVTVAWSGIGFNGSVAKPDAAGRVGTIVWLVEDGGGAMTLTNDWSVLGGSGTEPPNLLQFVVIGHDGAGNVHLWLMGKASASTLDVNLPAVRNLRVSCVAVGAVAAGSYLAAVTDGVHPYPVLGDQDAPGVTVVGCRTVRAVFVSGEWAAVLDAGAIDYAV